MSYTIDERPWRSSSQLTLFISWGDNHLSSTLVAINPHTAQIFLPQMRSCKNRIRIVQLNYSTRDFCCLPLCFTNMGRYNTAISNFDKQSTFSWHWLQIIRRWFHSNYFQLILSVWLVLFHSHALLALITVYDVRYGINHFLLRCFL